MPPSPSLITPKRLSRFLRYRPGQELDPEDAEQAQTVAVGWLSVPTGVEDWGTDWEQVPTVVRAWLLELAAISIENPTSMQDDQSGDTRSGWTDRRQQILAQAEAWAQKTGRDPRPTHSGASRGAFPPAPGWPDEAHARRWP